MAGGGGMKPEIVRGTSFSEYAGAPYWNRNPIKLLEEVSPATVRWVQTQPSADTPKRLLNRAIHSLVCEPDQFDRQFACYTGKIRRGKEFDAFVEANPGKSILNKREMDAAEL